MPIEIPHQLKEIIKRGEIVVFCGAGTSLSYSFPTWNSLIKEIINELKDQDKDLFEYINILDKNLLSGLEVLKKIEERGFHQNGIEILYSILNDIKISDKNEIHKNIGKITNTIITTNYDNCFDFNLEDFEKISYTNNFKVSKFENFEKKIFHIHGTIDEPDKCIFFPSQYEKHYKSDNLTLEKLKNLFTSKTILFIGFSLTDPYVNNIVDFVKKLNVGYNPINYIITTDNQGFKNDNRLASIVINDYRELNDILNELIKIKIENKKIEEQLTNDVINSIEKNSIIHIQTFGDQDNRPTIRNWVGREKELKILDQHIFKAIFITGIGGQGKSSLVSNYLQNNFNNDEFEFAVWRDFKEESNRLQTKIISVINQLSPKIDNLKGEEFNDKEIIDLFFNLLGKRKIIFVLDNVDKYIDLDKFYPLGGLKYLYEQILERNHNSKFIFTCRPFLKDANADLHQISLSGLSQDECFELLNKYTTTIKKDELEVYSNKIHDLTKGHPLWISILAGQAMRGKDILNKFISDIENKTNFSESTISSILSEKVLDQLWKSLNDKQRLILRTLAETLKPESEKNIFEILGKELTYQKFKSCLNTLNNLNLLEKTSDNLIELHPLVKEFVITKFSNTDRTKFISLVVEYYNKVIYILRPKLNKDFSIEQFQNWTNKIELDVKNNNFENALISLREITDSIRKAGFKEEFLRICDILFTNLDWQIAHDKEYKYFVSELFSYINTLAFNDQKDIAIDLISKYKNILNGKDLNYIDYCNECSYFYWLIGDFIKSVEIANEGLYLLNDSNFALKSTLLTNKALSLRDSREDEKVLEALSIFLGNNNLQELITNDNLQTQGHVYGNIGKCQYILGNYSIAKFLYFKSIEALLKENHLISDSNLGYAYLWLGQLYYLNNEFSNAAYFYKNSLYVWQKHSIFKFNSITDEYNNLHIDTYIKDELNNQAQWQIEQYCKKMMDSELKKVPSLTP